MLRPDEVDAITRRARAGYMREVIEPPSRVVVLEADAERATQDVLALLADYKALLAALAGVHQRAELQAALVRALQTLLDGEGE